MCLFAKVHKARWIEVVGMVCLFVRVLSGCGQCLEVLSTAATTTTAAVRLLVEVTPAAQQATSCKGIMHSV